MAVFLDTLCKCDGRFRETVKQEERERLDVAREGTEQILIHTFHTLEVAIVSLSGEYERVDGVCYKPLLPSLLTLLQEPTPQEPILNYVRSSITVTKALLSCVGSILHQGSQYLLTSLPLFIDVHKYGVHVAIGKKFMFFESRFGFSGASSQVEPDSLSSSAYKQHIYGVESDKKNSSGGSRKLGGASSDGNGRGTITGDEESICCKAFLRCLALLLHPTHGPAAEFPMSTTTSEDVRDRRNRLAVSTVGLKIREETTAALLQGGGVECICHALTSIHATDSRLFCLRILRQCARLSASVCELLASIEGFIRTVIDTISLATTQSNYTHKATAMLLSCDLLRRVAEPSALFHSSLLEACFSSMHRLPELQRENKEASHVMFFICTTLAVELCSRDLQPAFRVFQTSFLQSCLVSVDSVLVDAGEIDASTYVQAIEGTNYGYPSIGLLDGFVHLAHAILCNFQNVIDQNVVTQAAVNLGFASKEGEYTEESLSNVCGLFIRSGVWERLSSILQCCVTSSLISPLGTEYALEVVHVIVSHLFHDAAERESQQQQRQQQQHKENGSSMSPTTSDSMTHFPQPLSDQLTTALTSLLRQPAIHALRVWPPWIGGGSNTASILVRQIMSILFVPFSRATPPYSIAKVQKVLYNEMIISKVLDAISEMKTTEIDAPLGFVCRLVLGSVYFAGQFVQCEGLQLLRERGLFSAEYTGELEMLLIHSLQIVSQLARLSENHYELIHRSDLYSFLPGLLQHPSPKVRTKTCNLIGNLFRHSDLFYLPIRDAHILPYLVNSVYDEDPDVRKFACFAIGNCVYYSDILCVNVVECLPQLVSLLKESEKTAANAAGALGNLVRTSEVILSQVLQAGTVEGLLQCLAPNSFQSPRLIALLSLGNVCRYEEGVRAVVKANGVVILSTLVTRGATQKETSYANRILAKLQQPQQPA